jgi:RNA polymerase sigma factor (sigma-70 family)
MRDDPTVIDLVARAQGGDQHAWDDIVERFAPLVWGICRRFRLSEMDAHDVGQNVWLRLVEHLDKLREPAALPGWIATTTRRECIRTQHAAWDHEREQIEPDMELPADEEATQVDRWLLGHERDCMIRAAFEQLQPRCQQLLSMLMRDPPPAYAQISTALHMPIGAIGPNRARCLDKLRRSPLLAAFVESRTPAAGMGE